MGPHADEPAVEIETAASIDAVVIWLHGLGADGHDFEPIVPELGLPKGIGVRFVFPHAPFRPITINGGAVMRGWYDILHLGGPRRDEDEAGIRDAARRVEQWIADEVARGTPAQRLFLAGFSQGGAIALYAGTRAASPLAGIIALSTYLPLRAATAAEHRPETTATPIFMAHGLADEIIPFEAAQRSRDELDALGYTVEFREYPIAHQVSPTEIRAIGAWLGARLQAIVK